jgi:type IV pilus biogenesis protein CpaD/CtpE
MTPLMRLNVSFGVLAMLAGCAVTDPMLNDRGWHPSGVNEANIAAEVVNPADLRNGRELTAGSDGEQAAAAVLRLRTGRVKGLPDSSLSDLHVQGSPSPASPP